MTNAYYSREVLYHYQCGACMWYFARSDDQPGTNWCPYCGEEFKHHHPMPENNNA